MTIQAFDYLGAKLAFPHDDWMLKPITQGASYEAYVIGPFLKTVRPDDLVLDLGANVGTFAIPAARVAKRVIAVEMVPDNAKLIALNAELNGLTNIDIYPCAVSDRHCLTTFPILSATNNVATQTKFSVENVSLYSVSLGIPVDEILNGRQPDIVKIDVEGREYAALKDAKDIWKSRPIFFMEFAPVHQKEHSGVEAEELLDLFFSRGYTASILHRYADIEDVGTNAKLIRQRWVESRITHIDLMMKVQPKRKRIFHWLNAH